ncbi:M4 family metallopeptidase [Lacinutrix sp. Hel_I_90]|uniref:M4 family metallopeptidase n=1 Tax=Lacinutrix sp. Hel_I_90 TaxID=1249999 RepID=UPI0005C82F5D|nr:M4 family metallopeptidase [Lacinutrix sp. Hel_I_90]
MKSLKLLSFCLLFTCTVFAQNLRKSILDFQAKTKSAVTINDVSGVPEFIRFTNNNALKVAGSTLKVKAYSFLEANKKLYTINDVSAALVSLKTEHDNYGLSRVVLQQLHNGVPVYDGKLLVHFNSQKNVTAINGNYIPNIKLNAVPSLSKEEANAIALQEIEKQDINYSGASLLVHDSKLQVFNKGLARGIESANYLVYEVEVRNNRDVREFLFLDAHTGAVVEQYTGIAHALDRTVYENNTGNPVWQEGDAFPGTLSIWQQNEVVASGHTYHFFNNAFGFASYDGADAQMRTVNNDPNISCPNANWNGSTANYCDGTAADDVIGHEWGHAYTQFTSNLIYMWQSGAINESYSDIWGETIDLLNNYEDVGENNVVRILQACNESNRWLIGEDATGFSSNLRDMWSPTCEGDPGKVTDGQYICSSFDNGGVHINSGIPNHAYALLVDGGSYNGQVISGIGFTKAAHIFWRAQSQYLTATSDFKNLADALEASANDLIGINLNGLTTEAMPAGLSGESITAADVIQLNKVILAVELRTNPDACGYQALLVPAPDLCDAANTSPIFFEDWENGLGSWTLDQVIAPSATWTPRDWEIESSLPNNRPGSGIYAINAPIGDLYGGDCSSDFQNGILRLESPVITIPDFTDGLYELAFNHYVATEADWDGGNFKISIDGGAFTVLPAAAFTTNPYNGVLNDQAVGNDNPMRGEDAFTGSDEGSNKGSWGKSIIDLSSLGITANSTLQVRFDFGTDGCNGREGWYVDEFVVYNCAYVLSNKQFNAIDSLVSVYPNPSNGVFNLKKIGQVKLLTAEIHDINGRFIKAVDLSTMTSDRAIDLSQVASGLYFMTVTSEAAQGVIKLLKH